jgi:hypothetical protein
MSLASCASQLNLHYCNDYVSKEIYESHIVTTKLKVVSIGEQ